MNGRNESYEDETTLDIVKEMFRIAKETHKLSAVVEWLNQNHVPTPRTYYLEHGMGNFKEEVLPQWYHEKVWSVLKQEEYVHGCRHYERCMELGRHCDKKPIIDQETFDEVRKYCRYRENRRL